MGCSCKGNVSASNRAGGGSIVPVHKIVDDNNKLVLFMVKEEPSCFEQSHYYSNRESRVESKRQSLSQINSNTLVNYSKDISFKIAK